MYFAKLIIHDRKISPLFDKSKNLARNVSKHLHSIMAKDDTKQRILDAAHSCFAEHGWLGTTTQKIAHSAGVNEVTLFRHFGNKNRLFAEMCRSYIGAQQEVLSQTVAQDASLEEILTRFAEVYFQTIGSNPDYMRRMVGELNRHPDEVRQVVIDMMKPMREQFIQILSDRQERGEICREVNCEAAMEAFIGMLFCNIVKPRFSEPTYTREEFIAFAVQMFVRGVHP